MRTSKLRDLVHRELGGRIDADQSHEKFLIVAGIERVAAAVADRSDDAEAVDAVYAYALLRFGGWTGQRLVAGGVAPRVAEIGAVARRISFFQDDVPRDARHSTSEAAAAELIRSCAAKLYAPRPETPFARAEMRAWDDEAWLPMAGEATVRRLIADLADPDEETRWYAVCALRIVEAPEAAEPLLAILERIRGEVMSRENFTAAGVVRSALRASVTASTDDPVPLALRLLDHEDHEVQLMAEDVLRKATDRVPRDEPPRLGLAELRPVLRLIGGDPMPADAAEVRDRLMAVLAEVPAHHEVIQALKKWGDESCLPALTRALGRARAGHAQEAAAESIRAIGGDEALRRAVLQVLRDPDTRTPVAVIYAARLRLTEAVPDLIAMVRTSADAGVAAGTLAALDAKEAIPAIAAALARPLSPQQDLIRALTRLGPETAVETLIAAARHRQTRAVALDALARCPDPRAVDIVAGALLDGAIRGELVRPLADRGELAAVDALVHVILTTGDRRIRHAATRGLARAGQVEPDLVAGKAGELSGSVAAQTARLWLLGRLRPTRSAEPFSTLAHAARHSAERVRAEAVRSLALIGTPEALDVLRGMRDDPSRHVRACVEGRLRGG